MKKTIYFLLLICFCSCQDSMSRNDIEEIRNHYTNEEIKYFYEVVFGPEGLIIDSLSRCKIEKYEMDIKFFIEGEQKNKTLIKKTLDTLGKLTGLNITQSKTIKDANLVIFNTDRDKLNFYNEGKGGKKIDRGKIITKKSYRGMACSFPDKYGAIQYSWVIIPTDLPSIAIPHVVLEEITQTLGAGSDSFSYLNSIFYEGESYVDHLSELDKNVIRLLYSDQIKSGLTKNEFYNAFEDILQEPTISEQYNQFEIFISDSNFSKSAIRMFCEFAFSPPNKFIDEEHISKFENKHVNITGPNTEIIDSVINCLSENIKRIEFQRIVDGRTEASNLVIIPIKPDSKKLPGYWRYPGKIIRYQLYCGGIYYHQSTFKDNYKIIIKNSLCALGLNYSNESNFTTYNSFLSCKYNLPVIFSKTDIELFELFFSNTLKSGMTKSKVMEIIGKYYEIPEEDNIKKIKQDTLKPIFCIKR